MKRLDSVETEKIQLEIIECDCGFHIGLDATYLIQVGDFIIECPACSTQIYTKEVCPENETATPPDPQHGREPCKACKGTGEVDDTMHSVQAGMDITKPCPACRLDKVKLLAQYLAEYVEVLDRSYKLDHSYIAEWCELLEQALDAYQSTENVTIRIERV